ncbi:hypothetical protein [Streptomyces sp. NPDC048650]|uniref:hypothetical protein n=1 Tax=unclassified Streptomyces TaxID=2593676 RepID=UPI00371FDBD7
MDYTSGDLGRELRQLHAAAGSPLLEKLVELSHGRLPPGHRLTVFTVHGWLHDGAAPNSCAVLLAFVGLLDELAGQADGEGHRTRPPAWWEGLWHQATRPPAPPQAPPSAPPELEDLSFSGTTGNVIDGHSRITGPTVQAGSINGGLHVHPPAEPAAPPSPAVPQQRDARVVIRVERAGETIEFYDEGLARIWITAVLDQRNNSAEGAES